MNFEQMIAHIRAGGFAKRRHWQWAVIGWSAHIGPHRGDCKHLGTQIFDVDDIVSAIWYPCNNHSGRPGTKEGWSYIEKHGAKWMEHAS